MNLFWTRALAVSHDLKETGGHDEDRTRNS